MGKTKVIAMHLPQYHCIPENDNWWGKGFTDWVNVKKAKPIYKGHLQPLVPANHNYYDMTDIKTLLWQTDLAEEYGVYGFCYYHYWFNRKKLLEKPCEILLQHKEIKQRYCLCWANETWARTWDGKDTDILIEQTFGGRKDWEAHIEYLINFFSDDRYIKIDGRPVMFFYSCSRIKEFNSMIEYWNQKLESKALKKIFVVEFINSFNNGKSNIISEAVVEFEPHCAARYSVSNIVKVKRVVCKKFGWTDFLSYDYVWKRILNNSENYGGKKIIRSGFVSFDNSPRKGKKSMIIRGASPFKFQKYLTELLRLKNRNYSETFIVINAWNEWAEGAVLEPTEQFGYEYLKALRTAICDFDKSKNNSLC